jgi:hypothetical protein
LLVAQENFDRSSAKLAASALAVSSHRRPRRTPPRATVTGALRDGSGLSEREEADQ